MSDLPDRREQPDRRGKLIMELHTTGKQDTSAMQMITQERLDYYRRVEAEWMRLKTNQLLEVFEPLNLSE